MVLGIVFAIRLVDNELIPIFHLYIGFIRGAIILGYSKTIHV
jgi:hypothetical protein